ncbi:contractile injection system tape measure protein, partial [Mariniphaga sediminis]|uniref:contractile injection system tape measure protein n=1 Tax=Mariniphaga sediminis TaxID=1628158 RepID=UPI0035692131
MSEPTHIIEKMVVEINTDSQESAYAIKNDIGEFLEKELFPRLEKILDQFDYTGGVVRFNSLNLEIAPLRFSNVKDIEPEITRKLAEKLESSVSLVNGKKVETFEGEKVESISTTGNRENTFLFFLENGYLPWFGKEEYIAELTDLQDWQKSLTESNFSDRL